MNIVNYTPTEMFLIVKESPLATLHDSISCDAGCPGFMMNQGEK